MFLIFQIFIKPSYEAVPRMFLSLGLNFISNIVSECPGSVQNSSFLFSKLKMPTEPFLKDTKNKLACFAKDSNVLIPAIPTLIIALGALKN